MSTLSYRGLTALAVTAGLFAWVGSANGNDPIASVPTLLYFLAAFELVRQTIGLPSIPNPLTRLNDFARYRATRTIKLVALVAVLVAIVSWKTGLPPALAFAQLPLIVLGVLPFLFMLLQGFMFMIVQIGGLFWFLSKGGIDYYLPGDVKTTFADVWGQDHVVKLVRESLTYLDKPDYIEARGGHIPNGILLWGPPGTGKTLIAEAAAGETGKPYVFVDPGAFINMFMGVGILKVKALYRKLRKLSAKYGGVVVFFDEADSLGSRGAMPDAPPQRLRNRKGSAIDGMMMGMGGGGAGTLQALLAEMQGLTKPRGFFNKHIRRLMGEKPKPPPKYRIFTIMATNRRDALDEAMLRDGRINPHYKVGYPSKEGRVRTYQGYFAKIAHNLHDEQIDKLATMTPYATGASIKALVNESLMVAIRDNRETVTWDDVVKAKHNKDLGPGEDVEYVERERHSIAIHEGAHAVVGYLVRKHLAIDLATIEKGGTYLGMVASIPPEDLFTTWKSDYEADITCGLAAIAAEWEFFEGDNTSGVSGDLANASRLVTLMEGSWGMGDSLYVSGSKEPSADVQERAAKRLDGLMGNAKKLVKANKRHILAVAHALETHKTISGEDVAAVIEGRQGPLVDGRPYKKDKVRKSIADYHRAAAQARAEHRAVDVDLPSV